ncbi:MAG: hypothetical protein JWO78_1099 [Micavibrio sp.]|nr:hypothetical protein [Micavibrio sp.]
MMLNAIQNRRRGPGGSARRLHHKSPLSRRGLYDGAETGSTRVIKGKLVSVLASRYLAIFIFANDNFVVANDNTFAGDVAIAA